MNIVSDPFSPSSAWNTRIASDATYAAATGVASWAVGLSTWLEPDGTSPPIYTATTADPVVPMLYNPAAWEKVASGEWARYGNSAAVEAQILASSSTTFPEPGNPWSSQSTTQWVLPATYDKLVNPPANAPAQFYIPAGAHAAFGTDGHLAIFQPDGKVVEMFGTITLSTGEVIALRYQVTDPTGAGDGYQNGVTASMIPVYAGLLDDGDMAAGVIDHAIHITVPPQLLEASYIYPALAFDRGAMTESPPYSGTLPMGARLAIPQNVNLDSLGLETPVGKMIATAAQQYGFIIVDRGGQGITIDVDSRATNIELDKYSWSRYSDLDKIFNVVQEVTSGIPTAPAASSDPVPTPAPAPGAQPFALPVSGAPTTTKTGTNGTNNLIGTAGNDLLDGKEGADTLTGGAGDDTYIIDRKGRDVIIEKPGEGIDTAEVWSKTYSLAANVENMTLKGGAAHSVNGNALDNLIIGDNGVDNINAGAGKDIVIGGGGKDILTGGAGNDMFVYRNPADAGDVIKDFTSGEDLLDLRALRSEISDSGTNLIASGHVKVTMSSGNTIVAVDIDGPTGLGAPVMLITVENCQLKTSDFIWS